MPAALERAIDRCLKQLPHDRFGSVTELGAALAPFGTAVGARAFENAKRILPLTEPVPDTLPLDRISARAAPSGLASAPSPIAASTQVAGGAPPARSAEAVSAASDVVSTAAP